MFSVEARGLSRSFGSFKAVDNIDLTLHPGDIFALIGPNGAGKTTLIKMLVGLLSPTSGQALICGHDLSHDPISAKTCFGYVPDNPEVYGYLTGLEFLEMTGNLRGLHPAELKKRISQLMEIFPLKDILPRQMSSYSRGNRQKTAFLAALISKPPVLFIDEPIAGLDPTSIEIFGETLKSYAKAGGAVFLATHILSFGQEYASRVGVMSQGHLKKDILVGKVVLQTIYDQETR